MATKKTTKIEPDYIIGAAPLNSCSVVASWRSANPRGPLAGLGYTYTEPSMTIMASSACGERVHQPAESVTIHGREALMALRAAIDEALGEGGAS